MWNRAINRISKWVPTRAYGLSWVVINISALVVAFVPLFNLLGYESAALYGVILGVAATGLTVHAVRSGAVEAPLAASRSRGPSADFGRLALWHLGLAVGPMLILIVNGLRVPNCDWTAGFAFWALIVIPAVLLGQAAAWVAVAVVPDNKIAPWLIAFGFPVADGLALLHHLAMEPPIIGHQWFLGYFGGSIYDEALAVPASLIAYRVFHLLAIAAVVAAIEATFWLRRGRWPVWTLMLSLIATLSFSVGFAHRAEFGISIDRDKIAEELGGRVESEHFVIYYPKTTRTLDRLDEMIDDHEYRYHQLRRFFGTDPVAESGDKVTSFVYANRDSKGRLMGGRQTMVAKLWLHEMHILWSGTGDHMLTHELAHIFTEPIGAGPLRLSMQRGIGVNMGLVEGIAAAAEWRSGDLNPHEASAAMRKLEIGPDLRRILGAGGFWTEASGPAYTAMGSFVRYLVDTRGMEAFANAYPRGDFESAYGVSVEVLIDEWEAYVDEIELTARQRAVARYRYDRPSIFGKDCARALAESRNRARSAASRGAHKEACGYYEEVLDHAPDDTSSRQSYARSLGELDRIDEALAVIADRSPEVTDVEEAQFVELKGDLHWSRGDWKAAATAYEQALDHSVPVYQQRGLEMKRHLAARGDERGRRYLVDRLDADGAMYLAITWRMESPDDPIPAYFVGRRLWQAGHYDDAIAHLERSAGALHADVLDAEASLMLGQSYFFQGQFDASEERWEKLAQSPLTRYREAATAWSARTVWTRRNRQ